LLNAADTNRSGGRYSLYRKAQENLQRFSRSTRHRDHPPCGSGAAFSDHRQGELRNV